jgi:hypothetical protein
MADTHSHTTSVLSDRSGDGINCVVVLHPVTTSIYEQRCHGRGRKWRETIEKVWRKVRVQVFARNLLISSPDIDRFAVVFVL